MCLRVGFPAKQSSLPHSELAVFSNTMSSSSSSPSPFASMAAAMGSVSLGGGGGAVGGGQSLTDRVNAARYALAGQGLARTVCKATTEELMPPKKKHLDCESDRSHRCTAC